MISPHSEIFEVFFVAATRVLQRTVGEWMLWFNLYYGTLHFYFDGFLWKLRRPALRAQL